jgi:hypothetical protein
MKASRIFQVSLFLFLACYGILSAQVNPIMNSSEKRLALVIGNAGYQHSPQLANPINDARSMRDVLQSVGFDVYEYEDVNQSDLKAAIDKFGTRLKNYTVGLFFYSGHGIQSKGSNYLIPVDANISTEQQIEYDCVQADRVLGFMEAAGSKVNIVILDACRNNPFEKSWSRAVEGTGLAFMNAPTGSLIAYSTSPGRTASDGSGSNGLYTAALLENIKSPDITILQMFQNVRRAVTDKSYKQQIPWESTSLTNDFYFVSKAAPLNKVAINVAWEHTDTLRYRLYINEEDVSTRVVSEWSGEDLLVYDPVSNVTCLLEKFVKKPFNIRSDAKFLGSTFDAYWSADKERYYSLYCKGEQIAKRTNCTYVDNDLLVYDKKANNTYIFKDFEKNLDSKIRPAVLFDNADYAFWRKQKDDSFWLYDKGQTIQNRTHFGFVDKDLVVYDTISNITYQFKNFDTSDIMKLIPATVVSYQDNVFWMKKEKNLYYLINKGKTIQSHTTSEYQGDDLYVTDTNTKETYIFPNFTTATDGVLRVALRK